MTRHWPGKPRRLTGRDSSWDETRSVVRPAGRPGEPDSVELAAGFTLHPESDSSGFHPIASAETVGIAREGAPPDAGPIPFPRCGEGIGGFRLVAELGRGAFGRVYLAEESGLGNRPVALKVTRPEGDEPASWPGSSTRTSCRSTRSTTTRNPAFG